jgi:hypothetical protein
MAQVVVEVGVGRFELEGATAVGFGAREVAREVVQPPAVAVGEGVFGVGGDRLVVVIGGSFVIAVEAAARVVGAEDLVDARAPR